MSDYEIRRLAYDAVANGDATIVGEVDGEPVFEITDEARENAMKIIDSAIRNFGDDAAEILAESLGVTVEAAECLVALRK